MAVIIPVLLISTNCAAQLKIEGPVESYTPSAISPALSELPVTAEIDIKALETSINKRFNGLLYEGSNISDRDLTVKVWKAQNFSVFVNNDEITYRVPLRIWSKFAWKVEKFGLSVSDHYEATGVIALVYKTKIVIDNNWKVQSKTTSSGYTWLETPKINIVGVNIPVKMLADFALSRTETMITAQIDKTLAESFKLDNYVSALWNDIQKPMQMDTTYNLWIKIVPREILLSPFTSGSGKLKIPLAFSGIVESTIGTEPIRETPVPLPLLKKRSAQPGSFSINLGADITFDQITKVAAAQLVGQTFKEGRKSITVKGISMYSSEERAVMAMDVTGSVKGRIFLTGKMVYDKDSLTLSVAEPEFDIKTRNVLLKSASWLLHGMILKKITPYLTYNVAEDLEGFRSDIDVMLKKYSLYEGVSLEGALDTISVTDLALVPGAVRLQANLRGNVKIKVGEL